MRYEWLNDTEYKHLLPDMPPIPDRKTEPWEHQLAAFWWAFNRPGTLLAMGMGTGKSKVAVDLVNNNDYGHEHQADVLIICPKNPMKVWPREFDAHSYGRHEILMLDAKAGNNRQKTEKAHNFFKRPDDFFGGARVAVITYDSAFRQNFKKFSYNKKNGWDILIADECHRAKAAGGQISKYMHALGRRCRYRLGLTGTPMPNGPMDLYAQFRFLDTRVFGSSKAQYLSDFAIYGDPLEVRGRTIPQIEGWREKELADRYHQIAFQVGKDVLELPPELHVVRICELSAGAQKMYADLEDEFIAVVSEYMEKWEGWDGRESGQHLVKAIQRGDALVVGENILTRLLRLQQITGGYVTDDQGAIRHVDTAKSDLLVDLLQDVDEEEPVVVFCKFHPELDEVGLIAQAIGRPYAEISGRRSDALNEKAELAEALRGGGTGVRFGDGRKGGLVGVQIQSGGAGIDLSAARYGVYYSVGYSYGDYDQSVSRLHRPPQSRSVEFFHLVAESTVDEDVYRAIERKEALAKSVTQRLIERNGT